MNEFSAECLVDTLELPQRFPHVSPEARIWLGSTISNTVTDIQKYYRESWWVRLAVNAYSENKIAP